MVKGLSWFKAHSPRQGAGQEWETHEGGGDTGQTKGWELEISGFRI